MLRLGIFSKLEQLCAWISLLIAATSFFKSPKMCRLADDGSQFTVLPPQGQVSIPALLEDWKFDINQDKTRVQWPKNLKCPGIQKIVANINFREIGGIRQTRK